MRKPLIAIGIAAAAVIALPLIAQPAAQTPGTKNLAAVTGGIYTADAGHTLVRWEVDHMGFTPYFGIFGDVTGTLTIDPKTPDAAKVDVTIPVSKLTTASVGLTKHMFSPDFFGATPADARFVSTSVTVDGDDAKMTGNLTLNGITKPVTLDVDFYGAGKAPAQMGGKENVGFEAEATIKRSDFGIKYGIPVVSDAVKLDIVVAFQK